MAKTILNIIGLKWRQHHNKYKTLREIQRNLLGCYKLLHMSFKKHAVPWWNFNWLLIGLLLIHMIKIVYHSWRSWSERYINILKLHFTIIFAAGAVTRKVVATETKHLQTLLSLTGKNGCAASPSSLSQQRTNPIAFLGVPYLVV